MSLTPGILPLAKACGIAGGAVARRGVGADAVVPTWAPGSWGVGSLVLSPTNNTLYLSTAAHGSLDPDPAGGGPGWLQLTAAYTAIAPWDGTLAYLTGQPVRIDPTPGPGQPTTSRLFIANGPIPANTPPPDTAAGRAAGWRELATGQPTARVAVYSAASQYDLGDLVHAADAAGNRALYMASGPVAVNESPLTTGTPWIRIGP